MDRSIWVGVWGYSCVGCGVKRSELCVRGPPPRAPAPGGASFHREPGTPHTHTRTHTRTRTRAHAHARLRPHACAPTRTAAGAHPFLLYGRTPAYHHAQKSA